MKQGNKVLSVLNDVSSTKDLDNQSRGATIAGGALLAAAGMKVGKFPGFLMTIAGGALAMTGITGKNPLFNARKETGKPVKIRQSVVINKDRDTVYKYWRNLDHLSKTMKHVKKIEEIDQKVSRWTAEIAGIEVQWTAEIVYDAENWRISWTSTRDSQIKNAGKIEFVESSASTTRIDALITYEPKAGELGVRLAKVLNNQFERKVKDDILRFKEALEVQHQYAT